MTHRLPVYVRTIGLVWIGSYWMSGNPLIASTFHSETDVELRRQRHQTWWAIGVAFGVGVLSLILNAVSLYASGVDSRSRNMTVNEAADVETARWQALFAFQRDNAAQLATVKREQSRINEVFAALTNRLPVAANTAPAAIPTKVIHEANFQSLLDPLFFKNATDEDWHSDYEQYILKHSIDANCEKTQAKFGLLKTDAAILPVLPKLGGDNWRVGLIMVPNGPDGVNAKGVQSSSRLIGIKGSLP